MLLVQAKNLKSRASNCTREVLRGRLRYAKRTQSFLLASS